MISLEQVAKGLRRPRDAARYLLDNDGGASRRTAFLNEKEMKSVLWLHELYQKIDTVPGHIVELGVGPGTNAVRFGNLINLYGDIDVRMYYGFDTFNGYTEEDLRSSPHLDEEAWKDLDADTVRDVIERHGLSDVTDLIEGDLKRTLPDWLENGKSRCRSPGNLHVSLLYVDCNSYSAASAGIEELYEYLSPGAIVCVDELTQGGETRALREFCEERHLDFKKGESPVAWAPYTVVE